MTIQTFREFINEQEYDLSENGTKVKKVKQSDITKILKANFEYGYIKQTDRTGVQKVATVDGKRVQAVITHVIDSPMDATRFKQDKILSLISDITRKIQSELGGNIEDLYRHSVVKLPSGQRVRVINNKIRSSIMYPDYQINYITALLDD